MPLLPGAADLYKEALKGRPNLDVNTLHEQTFLLMLKNVISR